jgi:hypothetical protein
MTKLETFRKFLADQGYRPQLHDDYVLFQHEGGKYLIPLDDNDPKFFRIVFPNFWQHDTPEAHRSVLETAAAVTGSMKLVKVFPSGNDTVASVEFVLPDENAFREVFPRALTTLQIACREFCAAMTMRSRGNPVLDALKRLLGGGDGGQAPAA